MNMDQKAAEHIAELEAENAELRAQLEDAYVKIDLAQEATQDKHNQLTLAMAQIQAMNNSQKVNYGVA